MHRFAIVSLDLRGGTQQTPSASVVLTDGDGKVEGTGSGNGMIDAAIEAIAQATGVTGTITDFHVSSVTQGGDALGDVVIQLDADGTRASGRGVVDRRRRGVGPRLPRGGEQGRPAPGAPAPGA